MPRGRSKSIVQKIATDIPSYQDEVLNLGSNATNQSASSLGAESRRANVLVNEESKLSIGRDDDDGAGELPQLHNRNRAKSFCHVRAKEEQVFPRESYLFPLSNKEYEKAWSDHVETYHYNCVLDIESIQHINEVPDDFVLNFAENCKINTESIGELIVDNKHILSTLGSLTHQYNKVSHDTIDFANQSTELLNKQQKYEGTIQEIDSLLSYFEPLDSITRSLSRAGNFLIRKQKFRDILNQLDSSLEFLDQHANFREAESYKIRYRQCTTRTLTLIRNYLIDDLKSLNDRITAKMTKNKDSSLAYNVTVDMILYAEFSSHIPDGPEQDSSNLESGYSFYQFPSLVAEIVKRVPSHDEYKGLLDDVLRQYFNIRLALLHDYIWSNLNQQNTEAGKDKSLVQSCQSNISFFKNTIEKEYNLFAKFFGYHDQPSHQQRSLKEGLYDYFKDLADPLYDDARHKILKETNITSLCQLTILLQKYYAFEDDGSVNQSVIASTDYAASSPAVSTINYGELFEPILNDVQSRLIFRIQIYVDDKLVNYKSKPEDLKIGNRKRSSGVRNSVESQSSRTSIPESDQGFLDTDFDQNLFPDLYLPLGKALTILSNIYELINSVVFDDLAHYIVHSCIHILKTGAYKLALRHLGLIGAKLYYLKNLIVLQKQLNNFDIQFVRTETTLDFTSGFSEIYQVVRNGELRYNINQKGGLIELVKKSVPKVINNMIDAKYEIESELNNAVNDFVTGCGTKISEPILTDEKKLTDPLQNTSQFRDNLIIELPKIYKETKLFINDSIIVKFLMDNLSSLIVSTYETFYSSLEVAASHSDAIQQNFEEIMETDTLLNFVNELVSGLYDDDEQYGDKIVFNEDILNDISDSEPDLIEADHEIAPSGV